MIELVRTSYPGRLSPHFLIHYPEEGLYCHHHPQHKGILTNDEFESLYGDYRVSRTKVHWYLTGINCASAVSLVLYGYGPLFLITAIAVGGYFAIGNKYDIRPLTTAIVVTFIAIFGLTMYNIINPLKWVTFKTK